MSDNVNSPKHYTDGCIECIDAIEASMTKEQFVGYLKGNIQKYLWRMNLKHDKPSEDAYKARWYLNKLIETIDA